MGYYNVVKPCVVGNLHHVRPTTQPIEVDDETAAELVESGCLTPYRPSEQVIVVSENLPDHISGILVDPSTFVTEGVQSDPVIEPEPYPPAPQRPRGARRKD